jgi:hypothetical protein
MTHRRISSFGAEAGSAGREASRNVLRSREPKEGARGGTMDSSALLP